MTGANKHQCYFSEMTLSRLQKSIQHTNSIKCNNNILCCFIIKLTSFKLKQERKKKRERERERERKDFEVQLLSMNYHRNFLKYKIFSPKFSLNTLYSGKVEKVVNDGSVL